MKGKGKIKEQLIDELEPGDHICCLYETEEEHRALLTPFLRYGLEQGEKVLYIVDAHTAETVLGYLRDDGLEVEPYLTSGQLGILTADEAYMQDGIFSPDGMIALLRAETERALAEGYAALRVTGEMTWALRGLPGAERLIEYETKLNDFFPGSKCLAICQYDRRRFDPAVLLEVLRTHPIAIVGTVVYDNFYYIPPAELLKHDLPAVELQCWVQGLAQRRQAEEKLRESEQRYRSLVETARDVIYSLSTDGAISSLNPAFEDVTGWSPAEWLGKPFASIIHPDDLPLAMEHFRDALQGQTTPVHELRVLFRWGKYLRGEFISAPQILDGKVVGVWGIARDITERKRAEEELKESVERLRRMLGQTVNALSSMIEERDPYTASHQRRVTRLACAIAKEMGLREEQLEAIRIAGTLHDIGKINVPAQILNRPGKLSDLEMALIKTHPQSSYDIVRGIEFIWPVGQIILQHHERLDTSGYPAGLSGEEIVLEARILAVADVVEAMSSHRPYRAALGIDKALEEISQNRGILYDAKAVDACLKLFTEKGFKLD